MRATDSQFATNPLPVIEAMAQTLAKLHQEEPSPDLKTRTPSELQRAVEYLTAGRVPPHPYERISADTLVEMLRSNESGSGRPVLTHGAPTVANATITNGEAWFEGNDSMGFDPAERDLAIVLRSIAETFAPEATRAFLDSYEEAGGSLPDGRRLDWYALLAAFR